MRRYIRSKMKHEEYDTETECDTKDAAKAFYALVGGERRAFLLASEILEAADDAASAAFSRAYELRDAYTTRLVETRGLRPGEAASYAIRSPEFRAAWDEANAFFLRQRRKENKRVADALSLGQLELLIGECAFTRALSNAIANDAIEGFLTDAETACLFWKA